MDIEKFPQTALKFYKLRVIITRAWRPLGISRDEAADILIWAVGDDVKYIPFDQWPERIMNNTGIKFDRRQARILDVLRTVAKEWQMRKIKPIFVGGIS